MNIHGKKIAIADMGGMSMSKVKEVMLVNGISCFTELQNEMFGIILER